MPGDTADPHDGDNEASIPEGDRRGARSPHVDLRGDEDSRQGDLEGGAEVPKMAGVLEQAALRQIV